VIAELFKGGVGKEQEGGTRISIGKRGEGCRGGLEWAGPDRATRKGRQERKKKRGKRCREILSYKKQGGGIDWAGGNGGGEGMVALGGRGGGKGQRGGRWGAGGL